MAYECSVHVTVLGLQGSKTTRNRFLYYDNQVMENLLSSDVATDFNTTIMPIWYPCVSEQWICTQIKVAIYQEPPIYNRPEYTLNVATPGDVVGGVLAPRNVANLLWVCDNAQIDPPTAQPFEGGRSGISGIAESDQDDGILSDSAMTGFRALAAALKGFTATGGGDSANLKLALYRNPDTVPASPTYARCYVEATDVAQVLGGRDSRAK